MSVLANPVLWAVAAAVFALNLPFGYWRAGVPKFSRAWFLAVHLPVPGVVALRLSCKLGWHPLTFAALIGAFFMGQVCGGCVRLCCRALRKRSGAEDAPAAAEKSGPG